MKRIFKMTPGYDCCRDGSGCTHSPKGDHGVAGDKWFYTVVADDGLTAITLMVYTDRYPATAVNLIEYAKNDPIEKRVFGGDLSLCCAFPTSREEMQTFNPRTWGVPCEFVGRCIRTNSTSLGARELFKAHGDHERPEQSESFWLALEVKLVEWSKDAHAKRADLLYARCNHCDGLGTVAR